MSDFFFSIGQCPHNGMFFKGFDIQMKGRGLLSKNQDGVQDRRSASNVFHTIQQKPGSARSADVLHLNPNLTYWFRVIPKARQTEGEPSKVLRIGQGTSDCFWPNIVFKVKAVGPVGNRGGPERTRHRWHRSWNPLQPPPAAAPARWRCLPLALL